MDKQEFLSVLGERIKSLRLEKELTIETLAYSSDVTFATMSRIEHGKVNASIYVLYKISRSLEVELGVMLDVGE